MRAVSPARAATGERIAVREPRVQRAVLAWRACGGMRRPVVLRVRQQLRDEDEEHDLAGGGRVRPGPSACADGHKEQGGEIAPHRPLAYGSRCASSQSARPGSPAATSRGPWPVGMYAARLRERLRGFTRVQVFGEVFGFKAGRAKVWFELRDGSGALPCSMWREDFDALGLEPLADGVQVVAAGGCDYYPGSRTASPSFSFSVAAAARRRRGRPAGPARAAAARAARRGPVRAAAAAPPPGPAAHDRRRLRRARQGARRRDRRPAPARLGRARGVGVRARAGPPRRPCASPARCRIWPPARRSR